MTKLICSQCSSTVQGVGVQIEDHIYCERCREPVRDVVGYRDPKQPHRVWSIDTVQMIVPDEQVLPIYSEPERDLFTEHIPKTVQSVNAYNELIENHID